MNDLRLIGLLCIRTLVTYEAAALVPTATTDARPPPSRQRRLLAPAQPSIRLSGPDPSSRTPTGQSRHRVEKPV